MQKMSNSFGFSDSVLETCRQIALGTYKAPVANTVAEASPPAPVANVAPPVAPEAKPEAVNEISAGKVLRYVAKAARSTKDRTKGIDAAGRKLKVEGESDEGQPTISELSTGKMMQYVAKAARSKKDREKGINKVGKKIGANEDVKLSDAEVAAIKAGLAA